MSKPYFLQKLAIAGAMLFGVSILTTPQEANAGALSIQSPMGNCGAALAFATVGGKGSNSDDDLQCREAGLPVEVSATAVIDTFIVSASTILQPTIQGIQSEIDIELSGGFGLAGPDDPLVDPIVPVPDLPATAQIELTSQIDGSLLQILGSGSSNENAALEVAVVDTEATSYDEFVTFSEALLAIGSIEKALDVGFITSSQVLLKERENLLQGNFDFEVDFGNLNANQLATTVLTHGVTSAPVPEPSSILGLLTVGGLVFGLKRKKQSSN